MKVLKSVLCRVCNGFHLDSGKDIFNSFNGLTNTNFALFGFYWEIIGLKRSSFCFVSEYWPAEGVGVCTSDV